MSSVPYPTFVHQAPVDLDASNQRCCLSAVGMCRIFPATCLGTPGDQILRGIVDKNIQQAQAQFDASNKKLQKKCMKEGVAMAIKFLSDTLHLDVSVVDVEVYLDPQDLINTDGCLAACFLDAGCHAIVTDGSNLIALDCAKIPRQRLVAHFTSPPLISSPEIEELHCMITKAASLASVISLEFSSSEDNVVSVENVSKMMQFHRETQKELDYRIMVQLNPTTTLSDLELATMVGAILGRTGGPPTTLSLVDPTALQLGLSYSACIKTDRPDGLFATVVCTRSGEALGLVYSSKESVVASLESGRGVYYSRSRQGLWRKGDTSGHYQTLHRLDLDCDGDALRFTVTQQGDDVAAFCHLNTLTCWGEPRGLRHLEGTLKERLKSAPEGSYTKRLFDDEILLRDKLVEEAQELSEAVSKEHVAEELADVLYFAMTRAVKAGVSMDDAVAELDRRSRKVTRRQGDSKAFRIAAGNEILGKK